MSLPRGGITWPVSEANIMRNRRTNSLPRIRFIIGAGLRLQNLAMTTCGKNFQQAIQ